MSGLSSWLNPVSAGLRVKARRGRSESNFASHLDGSKYLAHGRWYRHRLVAAPIDVHMHEMAGGGRHWLVIAENRQLVAHAGVAQLRHPHAHVHGVRKRHRTEIRAARVDHQPDHLVGVDVEHPVRDQELIHGRVEKAVVLDVSHMSNLTHGAMKAERGAERLWHDRGLEIECPLVSKNARLSIKICNDAHVLA